MQRTFLFAVIVLSFIASGCSQTLAVRDLTADPESLMAGETVTVTMTFRGPAERVASVTGVVRQQPDFVFQLVDDGSSGDEMANDGVWSISLPVPFDAEPMTYTVDFTIRDVDGNVIVDEEAAMAGTTVGASISVTVQ